MTKIIVNRYLTDNLDFIGMNIESNACGYEPEIKISTSFNIGSRSQMWNFRNY